MRKSEWCLLGFFLELLPRFHTAPEGFVLEIPLQSLVISPLQIMSLNQNPS